MNKVAFVLLGLGALYFVLGVTEVANTTAFFVPTWFFGWVSWTIYYNTPEQKLIRKQQGKKY